MQASRVISLFQLRQPSGRAELEQQQRVGRRSGIEKPVPRQFGRLRRGVKVVQYNIAINESCVEAGVLVKLERNSCALI